MRRSILAALFSIVLPATAAAQERGPQRGTWGGELCFNCGATLLRFRDSTSAWLLGFDGRYWQARTESTSGFGRAFSGGEAAFFIDLSTGLRFYRLTSTPARPFISLRALAGVVGGPDMHGSSYGAGVDMGTAYFFSPHLSLGVFGAFSAVQSVRTTRSGSASSRSRIFTAGLTGANLLASVYF